jgi:serine phosphatase RsbU (regulator of sigma subunit)
VDEQLRGKTVELNRFINGAGQFWLNGELIHEAGIADTDPDSFEAGKSRDFLHVTFSDDPVQLLAVRHVHTQAEFYSRTMWTIGLTLWFRDIERSRKIAQKEHRFFSGVQWGVTSFSLFFGLLHLILFLFNRRLMFNLWFSLVCLLYAYVAWSQNEFYFSVNLENMVRLQHLMQSSSVAGFGFLILFLFSVEQAKPPKLFLAGFGLTLILALLHNLILGVGQLLLMLGLVLLVYLIWRSLLMFRKNIEGGWILGLAVLIFVGATLTSLGFEMAGHNIGSASFSVFHLPYLGFASALIAMSVFQSQHIARINLSLANRLREVKQLSEKSLEQERSLRQAAVERTRLETENERKTAELEQARNLQLSLLPKTIPQVPGYTVVARMQTATEVGGDYYDALAMREERITLVIGDASGHGAEAGFLAAMTKTLVLTLVPGLEPDEALRRMSAELKKAGLKKKFMCLGLIEINPDIIRWCSAGIPALVHYRSKQGVAVKVESKGMPLGTVTGFTYSVAEIEPRPGDMVFAISDGLMEQMNSAREQLGEARILQQVEDSAAMGKKPDQIIDDLLGLCENWKNLLAQQDDITFIGIRKHE